MGGCDKIFCKDHFAYQSHNCPGAKAKDKRVIVCPLCSKAVPHPVGEDANLIWEQHASSGDCRPASIGTAAPSGGPAKPKCPVKGCKEKLTCINQFKCPTCNQCVCMKHRFEDLHDCCPVGNRGRQVAEPCRNSTRNGQKKMPYLAALQRLIKYRHLSLHTWKRGMCTAPVNIEYAN